MSLINGLELSAFSICKKFNSLPDIGRKCEYNSEYTIEHNIKSTDYFPCGNQEIDLINVCVDLIQIGIKNKDDEINFNKKKNVKYYDLFYRMTLNVSQWKTSQDFIIQEPPNVLLNENFHHAMCKVLDNTEKKIRYVEFGKNYVYIAFDYDPEFDIIINKNLHILEFQYSGMRYVKMVTPWDFEYEKNPKYEIDFDPRNILIFDYEYLNGIETDILPESNKVDIWGEMKRNRIFTNTLIREQRRFLKCLWGIIEPYSLHLQDKFILFDSSDEKRIGAMLSINFKETREMCSNDVCGLCDHFKDNETCSILQEKYGVTEWNSKILRWSKGSCNYFKSILGVRNE